MYSQKRNRLEHANIRRRNKVDPVLSGAKGKEKRSRLRVVDEEEETLDLGQISKTPTNFDYGNFPIIDTIDDDSDIILGDRLPLVYELEVARAIARLIALALDLNLDFFDQPEMLGEPIATLRLLHYEDQTSDPANGIFGAGAHSDYGLITLLATDDVLGLQICKDKDAKPQIWEYVPPLKG
ncbi:hypothetical protein OROGR_029831 [Orobanche gracilis]